MWPESIIKAVFVNQTWCNKPIAYLDGRCPNVGYGWRRRRRRLWVSGAGAARAAALAQHLYVNLRPSVKVRPLCVPAASLWPISQTNEVESWLNWAVNHSASSIRNLQRSGSRQISLRLIVIDNASAIRNQSPTNARDVMQDLNILEECFLVDNGRRSRLLYNSAACGDPPRLASSCHSLADTLSAPFYLYYWFTSLLPHRWKFQSSVHILTLVTLGVITRDQLAFCCAAHNCSGNANFNNRIFTLSHGIFVVSLIVLIFLYSTFHGVQRSQSDVLVTTDSGAFSWNVLVG